MKIGRVGGEWQPIAITFETQDDWKAFVRLVNHSFESCDGLTSEDENARRFLNLIREVDPGAQYET